MRIVAGSLKGRRLAGVPHGGVRPTPERVREAVFNILGQDLSGVAFLDLYAGTGAMGLEAASRAAAPVVLVEEDPAAHATCLRNIEALGVEGRVHAVRSDAAAFVARTGLAGREFDVVFADPPYSLDRRELDALVAAVEREAVVAAAGVLVVQMRRGRPAPAAGTLVLDRPRHYGITTILIYDRPT